MNPQELLAEIVEQVRGVWRYRWWAVSITWAIALAGWIYVYTLPDVYRASARVYVDTNSLLKPLMQGLTAQQNTMNEVQVVSTAVLSRPNLEAVARKTDLDLRTNTTQEFEMLVTGLQTRIKVRGGGDNIFTIQYEDNSREKAREVVAAVLDTFVEDALGAQGDDAEVSERALAGEIADHEQRLRNAENALASFKKDNLGYMPGESGDYYVRLQTALAEQGATEEQVRQLEQRRTELSRQIEGEEPVFGIMPTSDNTAGCTQRTELLAMREQLAKLLVDFTEKHPRVTTLKETIAALEARCATERANSRGAVPVPVGSKESLEINPVYQNLRIQSSNTEVELVEARAKLNSRRATVDQLKRDVDKIADVEAQLKQLNRDYDVIQARHKELLKRWEDLQAKKRLDPVTDNVQFRRIEPPFALADPVGPNRPIFLLFALGVALAGGLGIAFGLNLVTPVFFSRRAVRRVTGLPVLGSISMVVSPATLMRRRTMAVVWAATYGVLFVATGFVVAFSSKAVDIVRVLSGGAAS